MSINCLGAYQFFGIAAKVIATTGAFSGAVFYGFIYGAAALEGGAFMPGLTPCFSFCRFPQALVFLGRC